VSGAATDPGRHLMSDEPGRYDQEVNDQSPMNLPALTSSSRREQVADILREQITTGELVPGQRLTEAAISAQLGTSRAPVREALRQLEQEGLVVSYPYRGTEVLGVSHEEVVEVLVPVRLALERFAFVKAASRLDDVAIARLDALVEAMRTSPADRAALADSDIAFHEAVILLSDQPHCMQIWKSIQPRVRAYFRRDAAYRRASDVAQQHVELVEALKSHDDARILAAITHHINIHSPEEGQQ
jgi:DNA-binding GntR family transcriptional regulator